jgi:hypothetical protein
MTSKVHAGVALALPQCAQIARGVALAASSEGQKPMQIFMSGQNPQDGSIGQVNLDGATPEPVYVWQLTVCMRHAQKRHLGASPMHHQSTTNSTELTCLPAVAW